mgnify:CR=1 FL=1
MKWGKLRVLAGVLLILIVGLTVYVRLAPTDPQSWQQQGYPSGLGERVSSRGYIWREAVSEDGKKQLMALQQIITDTPRTKRVAGSIEEKQITFVTRSLVMGFPDYTTIGVYDGLIEDADQRYLEINGRLRFGTLDFGVNAKRIKGWLAEFKAGR